MLWRRAVEAIALVVDGDHGEDREFRGSLVSGQQGLASFIERRHGLDDEKVDAGILQGSDLLDKCGTGFVEARFAEGLQANAEGADASTSVRMCFSALLGVTVATSY